ncbi:hypothetical protein [Kitasatospora sp. NPDC058478]|uniref:hypothetical protein n=1 Tax=unclassified Kitasatospora TaxID=2633591 RepID=UPI00364B7C22
MFRRKPDHRPLIRRAVTEIRSGAYNTLRGNPGTEDLRRYLATTYGLSITDDQAAEALRQV